VSAAIGRDVWQNTTNLIFSSPFEYYNIENHPKATLHTRHVPQTTRAVVSNRGATTAQHTTSVLIATAPDTITPEARYPLATTQTWPSSGATNDHDATGHTNHYDPNLEASVNASINQANTTIVVWTVPSSTTMPSTSTPTSTPTPTPTPRGTAFRHFINSASPYLEACSLLVVVCSVGKFAYAKIQRYRGQRSNLPVIEET
jgi:hypothetical protein